MYISKSIKKLGIPIFLTSLAFIATNYGAYQGTEKVLKDGITENEVRCAITQFYDRGTVLEKAKITLLKPGVELALWEHNE